MKTQEPTIATTSKKILTVQRFSSIDYIIVVP